MSRSKTDQEARSVAIHKLQRLLDVAGTLTPWEDIVKALETVPTVVLGSLAYRTERAVAAAFDDGVLHGQGTGNP
jgi:hypothetical protein